MNEWFSASELAGLGLSGVAATLRNCSAMVGRIRAATPELVRPRKGRGGGYEVHVSALPEAAQADLRQRELKAAAKASEDQVRATERDKRELLASAGPNHTHWQNSVMTARLVVLADIDRRVLFLDMGRDRAIRELIAAAAAGTLPSEIATALRLANNRRRDKSATIARATIYNWLRARDELGPIGLLPDLNFVGRKARKAIPKWFSEFFAIYGRPSKPSVNEALREYKKTLAPGQPCPTAKQVYRLLKHMNHIGRAKGRVGTLAMRAMKAYKLRDFTDLQATSVYVADGKTFDAEIAHPLHGHPFRPELSTLIDVATRRIVGWSASLSENTFCVLEALKDACKNCGIPAIFYTDRGPGYANKAMLAPLTGFMARAGITPMQALPYNSQAKGVVERVNQIYTAAAKALPTYLGKSMDKEAAQLAHKTVRREIAQTGTSRLLMSWPAFLDHISETISDYNNRPHSSLPKFYDEAGGKFRTQTPLECWAHKTQDIELILPDEAEMTDMFRPWVVRRSRRGLVMFNQNSYFAIELEGQHNRDVIVGYELRDATQVWVREIVLVDGERQPGKLLAVAKFNGHKTRYVPVPAERTAIENRARGRIRRLQGHMDEVREELRPQIQYQQPAKSIIMTPSVSMTPRVPAAAMQDSANDVAPAQARPTTASGRPIFGTDEVAYVTWLMANRGLVGPQDIINIKELLNGNASREMLRMEGVDLVTLEELARSAA